MAYRPVTIHCVQCPPILPNNWYNYSINLGDVAELRGYRKKKEEKRRWKSWYWMLIIDCLLKPHLPEICIKQKQGFFELFGSSTCLCNQHSTAYDQK